FFLADAYIYWKENFYRINADKFISFYTLLVAIATLTLLRQALRDKHRNRYFLLGSVLSLALTGLFYGTHLFFYAISRGIWYLKLGFTTEIVIFAIGLAYNRRRSLGEQYQLELTIEQQKWEQQQLDQETKRIKEVAAFKTQLYTNITHEFRTPLTVILGMANQIAEKPREWQQQGLQMIQRSGQNLLNLVNQMLDLAKIEAGRMQPKYVQGNIILYLQYLVEAFHSYAATKDINLVFYKALDDIVMDYDVEKLRTVLTNLLSNAVKFTPEKGKIIVHTNLITKAIPTKKGVTRNESFCQLKIRDNGIGIAPAKLPHVFDRFYQVEDDAHYSGGTGVGLALTKELIELMNGTITVKSSLNDGSEFVILLPFRQTAPLVKDPAPALADLPVIHSFAVSAPSTLPSEDTDDTLPLVLVMEDNLDVITYLQACLMDRYRVIIALDGQSGIDKAIEHTPDLIISDVMMPEKDGFEVCDYLKKDERTSHIPIILLTARAHIADKLMGLSKGADAYLAKPFHRQELEIRLEQLLFQRQRLQTFFAQQTTVQNSDPLPDLLSAPIENAFLEKVEQVIEANLMADLDLEQVCQLLAMSRSQVYRKIKALTGYSTTIYIRRIRLRRAYQLLKTTDATVSEVAYQVGFKDPSFFSRSFSEVFQQAPSEVKKGWK
ncbi:MAG: ATP-binding protein, partial [Bacteroidota bacterium]